MADPPDASALTSVTPIQPIVAVQRLSDLVFTVQSYTRATFGDEFENYVVERKLPYERGVQIELPGGYRFTADFLIKGEKVVQLLSASSAGYARERVDRVYVNFSELRRCEDKKQKLAVIDSRQPFWDLPFIDLFVTRQTASLSGQKGAIWSAPWLLDKSVAIQDRWLIRSNRYTVPALPG